MRRTFIGLGLVIGVLAILVLAFHAFHNSTWGSIYIAGGATDAYGMSSNAASEDDADALAKQACEKNNGGSPCIKIATYEDACAAVARSTSHYYENHNSANVDDAKGRALTLCNADHNDGSCTIVVDACSSQAASGGQ